MSTAVGELWALARRRRRRWRVEGRSMVPTLEPGSFVIVDPSPTAVAAITPGDVVVVRHPARELAMIKRVTSVDGGHTVEVGSDNPAEGTDSRHFGPVSSTGVVGVVTRVLEWPFPAPGPRRGR